MSNIILTQAKVRELFYYDGKQLVWKIIPKGKNKVGKVAGCVCKSSGYTIIGWKGKYYKAHRLIWLYVYGNTPNKIDHINHNRSDNRIENLRSVDYLTNSRNRKADSVGKNPYTGVTWNKRSKKWVVSIKPSSKRVHLGYFNDLEEAISIRLTANNHYGFHENHGLL